MKQLNWTKLWKVFLLMKSRTPLVPMTLVSCMFLFVVQCLFCSFFRFAHEHNDNVIESVLMIYVCPGTAKVKERMIYSSSKTNIASLASQCGIKVEKNIELSEIADLSSDFLYNYLHASVTAPKESFSKPKRPTKKK